MPSGVSPAGAKIAQNPGEDGMHNHAVKKP